MNAITADTIGAIRDAVRHPLDDFIQQIECLLQDMEDVYDQAGSFGYDAAAIRELVAERARDRRDAGIAERLELYRAVVA